MQLSDRLFGKSRSHGLPLVLFEMYLFAVLVISQSGSKAGFPAILIVSVPGKCIPFTFHYISSL